MRPEPIDRSGSTNVQSSFGAAAPSVSAAVSTSVVPPPRKPWAAATPASATAPASAPTRVASRRRRRRRPRRTITSIGVDDVDTSAERSSKSSAGGVRRCSRPLLVGAVMAESGLQLLGGTGEAALDRPSRRWRAAAVSATDQPRRYRHTTTDRCFGSSSASAACTSGSTGTGSSWSARYRWRRATLRRRKTDSDQFMATQVHPGRRVATADGPPAFVGPGERLVDRVGGQVGVADGERNGPAEPLALGGVEPLEGRHRRRRRQGDRGRRLVGVATGQPAGRRVVAVQGGGDAHA